MSLPFITQRERVTVVEYQRVFDRVDCPGAGWSFDCDKSGRVRTEDLQPAAREAFERCSNRTYDVIDRGVQDMSHSYWQPASVRCDCYSRLWLEDAMYNVCEKCGLAVNGSGQRLRPIEEWEPEDQYAVLGPRQDETGD